MKRSKLTLPALVLATALAMGCSAGGAGDHDYEHGNGGNTTPPSGGNGGYDMNNKWHPLADGCTGKCREDFRDSRGFTLDQGGNKEAYDDAVWSSWYKGGAYHDSPTSFKVTNSGYYTVNIDGKPKSPCFSAQDRAYAEQQSR
jgi:hypothetical protein